MKDGSEVRELDNMQFDIRKYLKENKISLKEAPTHSPVGTQVVIDAYHSNDSEVELMRSFLEKFGGKKSSDEEVETEFLIYDFGNITKAAKARDAFNTKFGGHPLAGTNYYHDDSGPLKRLAGQLVHPGSENMLHPESD